MVKWKECIKSEGIHPLVLCALLCLFVYDVSGFGMHILV